MEGRCGHGREPRRVGEGLDRGELVRERARRRVQAADLGEELVVDTRTGQGREKSLARRRGLYEVNALHLNNLKGAWTWVADAFAIALVVLATSGLFMLDGARGLAGRGKYFVLAGLVPPAIAIAYLYA